MKTPNAHELARQMLMRANARMDMAGMRVLYPATEDIAARIAELFTDQIPSLETPSEPALVQGFRAGRFAFYHQLDQWRHRHCTLPDVFRLYFLEVLTHLAQCANAHEIAPQGGSAPWQIAKHGPLLTHYHSLELTPRSPRTPIQQQDILYYADWVLNVNDKNALRYRGSRHG